MTTPKRCRFYVTPQPRRTSTNGETPCTSQTTGKEWACRPLSLLVPFHTEKGEEKYDNIVADYFGDADDGLLNSYVQQKQLMHFTVSFTTRTHNGRRYQSARVFNLAAVV